MDYVKIVDLAAELERHPTSLRRKGVGMGLEIVRFGDVKNSATYLSLEDADRLRERCNSPFESRAREDDHAPSNPGVYLIEVPSYAGQLRYKVGWSDNVGDRFDTYRTLIPDLRVLRVWPVSQKHLERTALMIAEQNGRRVHTELFEFDDAAAAIEKFDALFELVGVPPTSYSA